MRWNIVEVCYASQIEIAGSLLVCDVCEQVPHPSIVDGPPWHRLTQATLPVLVDPPPISPDKWTCFDCAVSLAVAHMADYSELLARECVETALHEQHRTLVNWRCDWNDAGNDYVEKHVSPYRLVVHKSGRPARVERDGELVSGLEASFSTDFDAVRYDAVWLATHGIFQRRIAPTVGLVGSGDTG